MNKAIFFFPFLIIACTSVEEKVLPELPKEPFIIVLGIAQDAGYPQAGCYKDCCKGIWNRPEKRKMVSCLALVDPVSGERWLFDCTPDFPKQLQVLDSLAPAAKGLSGIFLTHAHIGHYTGLMHL